jgi:hypothetical protein
MDGQNSKQKRPPRVRAAITIVSALFGIISFVVVAYFAPVYEEKRNATEILIQNIALVTAGISALTLIVTSVSTASNIVLGWRNDRRLDRESQLKIQQLELQLEEMRQKAQVKPDAPQGAGNQP